jgi:hypothetical protein
MNELITEYDEKTDSWRNDLTREMDLYIVDRSSYPESYVTSLHQDLYRGNPHPHVKYIQFNGYICGSITINEDDIIIMIELYDKLKIADDLYQNSKDSAEIAHAYLYSIYKEGIIREIVHKYVGMHLVYHPYHFGNILKGCDIYTKNQIKLDDTNDVHVRWFDGHFKKYSRVKSLLFGCDNLSFLATLKIHHEEKGRPDEILNESNIIPLRNVRWFSLSTESHQNPYMDRNELLTKTASVNVKWFDDYTETFTVSEMRSGSDLLWLRLTTGENRHIPLKQVREIHTADTHTDSDVKIPLETTESSETGTTEYYNDKPERIPVLSVPGDPDGNIPSSSFILRKRESDS